MQSNANLPLGATYSSHGNCDFLVWAPRAKNVDVHILGAEDRFCPMSFLPRGYFHARVRGAGRAEESPGGGHRPAVPLAPADRLMVATAPPYLAPDPYGGRSNDPAYLPRTLEVVAGLRHQEPAALSAIVSANSARLFRLPLL